MEVMARAITGAGMRAGGIACRAAGPRNHVGWRRHGGCKSPRYVMLHNLARFARGGMADLFSATVGGEPVLVKVPRSDRAAAGAALDAEGAALARFGGTVAPRLVGRTRVGAHEALVIEHLLLPTLRSIVEGTAERLALPATAELPDDVDRLALAVAACDAIAQVHAAGMVHGDLKPDNLLVDAAAGQVRVIDFGAAAPCGRKLGPSHTAAYAAPERTETCVAAPAVDVYALGIVIFELFTGELPFGHGERARVRRPPAIAEHVEVGGGLDAAIARALAADPSQRPRDAGELAAMLRQAALTPPVRRFRGLRSTDTPAVAVPMPWGVFDASAGDARPTTVITGVWHVPLVGRAGAITTLAEAAATARAGLTTLVTVWGDAGLGKSRLVEEARALAEAQGLVVVEVPASRATAAGLASALDTRGGPRAVIVDDAHAADPLSLDAIELATAATTAPLMVVVLARPALMAKRPWWGRRAARHESLRLAPLSPVESRLLARALLPEVAAVPVLALDRLVQRCGGVPLLVVELMRAMARNGLAVRDDIPGDQLLDWAIADELAALPPAAVAAAEWIAGAGRVVTRGDVDPRALWALLSSGLVVDGGDRIELRHELVRDAIARRLGVHGRR
jgi:hypothetical protein